MFMCDFAEFLKTATIPMHALRHIEGSVEESTRKEWLNRIAGGPGCWISFEPCPETHDPVPPRDHWDGSMKKIEECKCVQCNARHLATQLI